MVFLGVLEGNRYFCVMCCVPISGYLFAGAEDRSTWLRVLTGFASYFQPFYAMQEGNWWMADHEPARRRGSQIVCCLLCTPISRGDVLEVWFLVDSKCNCRRC